jgi:hypothetical protein
MPVQQNLQRFTCENEGERERLRVMHAKRIAATFAATGKQPAGDRWRKRARRPAPFIRCSEMTC